MVLVSQSDDRNAYVGEAVPVAATWVDGDPTRGTVYFRAFTPETTGRYVLNMTRRDGEVFLEVETPEDDIARIVVDVYESPPEPLSK